MKALMKALAAAMLGLGSVGALATEVTVIRPKSIISEDWEFYVVLDGKPVTDVRSGERATFQVPPQTRSLAIHCPKVGSGYEEVRIEQDFGASANAFLLVSPAGHCVDIKALDAGAAAPLVRTTRPRANRRMEYDRGQATPAAVAAAAPAGAAVAAPAEPVSAATAAWIDAFNSRDPARVMALYDAEAVLTDTSEANPRVGTAAIADYYKANAQRTTQRAALGERNIRLLGDTAIDSGTLTFFEMRNGQATTTPARYSLTYRNRGGRWLIVDHQSSPAPR
jgi:uncharacterized protein (TIGR02246 family)